jgi:hypothetical protein
MPAKPAASSSANAWVEREVIRHWNGLGWLEVEKKFNRCNHRRKLCHGPCKAGGEVYCWFNFFSMYIYRLPYIKNREDVCYDIEHRFFHEYLTFLEIKSRRFSNYETD